MTTHGDLCSEIAQNSERDLILNHMLKYIKSCKKHAGNLLSDSSQNKPEADRWELMAKSVEDVMSQIEAGWHRGYR